jgi:hypothetical protein
MERMRADFAHVFGKASLDSDLSPVDRPREPLMRASGITRH